MVHRAPSQKQVVDVEFHGRIVPPLASLALVVVAMFVELPVTSRLGRVRAGTDTLALTAALVVKYFGTFTFT